MKCPKCRYISFDNGDRCRNCGYEFSLAADLTDLDLPIRTGEERDGPLSDFALGDLNAAPPAAPDIASSEPARSAGQAARGHELPLFRDRGRDDDRPLVSLPAVPRAPVAVRKSTIARPASPRPPAPDEPGLDLEPGPDPTRRARALRPADVEATGVSGAADHGDAASIAARAGAAVIDLALMTAIDLGVLVCTLRLCGLALDDVAALPPVPFITFLAILNGGYMAAFTAAGGQSIGKMITGIKVVTMDEADGTGRVPLGQAILRAASYLVSALPAGLGFLPGLFGAERRAVHDRLAHTRVVKA